MQKADSYNSILVDKSGIDSIKAGKIYAAIHSGDAFFVFDEHGKKTRITGEKMKWKDLDPVVMIVRIKTSLLPTVVKEKVYRVFDDRKNDERYIFDENGEKVLFDRMIFSYELI